MFVGPVGSLTAFASITWRRQLRSQYESGTFSDALTQFMGDFGQASQDTKDLIWQLEQYQDPTPITWRHGQWGLHTEDMAIDRSQTLQAFAKAAGSLLRDYGVDMGTPLTFTLAEDGSVVLSGDHADKAKIESLINGSYLLRNSVTKVFSLTQELVAARLSDARSGSNQLSGLGKALSMTLSQGDEGLVGLMKLYNTVVSDDHVPTEGEARLGAVDEMVRDFDAAEARRLKEYERTQTRHRVENAEKETAKRKAHKADVDERVAEQHAAERTQQLHPELSHRPVFI